MKIRLIFTLCALFSAAVFAQTDFENNTNQYFETIKNDPQQLLIFLESMPKGGDLHYHMAGSGMAENMIRYANGDHFCVDRASYGLSAGTSCSSTDTLENAPKDTKLYNSLIDAWSMRNFHSTVESGHDHFFA